MFMTQRNSLDHVRLLAKFQIDTYTHHNMQYTGDDTNILHCLYNQQETVNIELFTEAT